MLRRLGEILFGCGVLLAVSGCPKITPEKSAREWLADGRTHSAQARWDDAVADFTEVLRLEPKSREALILRAHASLNNGDGDQALEDCQAALDLQPKDIDLLRFRANIYRRRGEYETAENLDRETNRLIPLSPEGLDQQGNGEMGRGDYASASRHFEKALKLEPHNAKYLNNVAWMQAACPDDRFRDGPRAVELAMEACQLTQWRDALIIDTLAAAYAESGQFDKAVNMQQKATDMVPARAKEGFRRRLRVYQESKPYRFVNGQ